MIPGRLTDDDFEILEFIGERDLITDVKTVEANLSIGYHRVNNRMRRLRELGLLKKPETTSDDISSKGLYEITELGLNLAKGDVSVGELRDMLDNQDRD